MGDPSLQVLDKFNWKIPESSTSWLQLLAAATTPAVACVTALLAVPSCFRLVLLRSALTLLATTSCAVLAAISCEATMSGSNLASPRTTLSAHDLKNERCNELKATEEVYTIEKSQLSTYVRRGITQGIFRLSEVFYAK